MYIDLIIILLLIFLLVFLWISYTKIFGAEFVRMPKYDREVILKMLNLSKKDIFYDLGCGDASLIIQASPKVKKAVGIEIDPIRFLISMLKVKIKKIKNIRIIYSNLFNILLSEATAIAIFLSKEANVKLGHKLKQELKKKTLIASYRWPVPYLKLISHNAKHRIFLYTT